MFIKLSAADMSRGPVYINVDQIKCFRSVSTTDSNCLTRIDFIAMCKDTNDDIFGLLVYVDHIKVTETPEEILAMLHSKNEQSNPTKLNKD